MFIVVQLPSGQGYYVGDCSDDDDRIVGDRLDNFPILLMTTDRHAAEQFTREFNMPASQLVCPHRGEVMPVQVEVYSRQPGDFHIKSPELCRDCGAVPAPGWSNKYIHP